MKNRVRNEVFFNFVILSLIIVGFNNCSKMSFEEDYLGKAIRSGETVVGNPMTAAAKTVLTKACDLVASCHTGVTSTQCETKVLALGGIDYQLGLGANSFSNYSAIIESESSGALTANAAATASCLAGIEKIKCSDSAAQGAYNSATDSFDGVVFLLPTTAGSCPAIFSQPPKMREYYVTSTGSDSGDGSFNNPWASITHASRNLVLGEEGTTVHVAPGTYTAPVALSCDSNGGSCGVKTERSGTNTARITYISDQAGAAKIVAAGASSVWYNSGDYVSIVGFEIQGSTSSNYGIHNEAAFGQMIGNHVHSIPVTTGCAVNRAGGGIVFGYLASAHDNDAIGNRIHNIGPQLANGLPQSSYCNGKALGISYNQPGGKVQNNIIYNVDNWAIGTWNAVSNLHISHNLLFDNGNTTDDGSPFGGAIFISGDPKAGVHNGTTVSNNIIRNNSGKGINEFASVGANNLYVNNLMFSNNRNFDLISGVTPQGTIFADPLMVNFALDGSGDYRLTAISPAVDAGSVTCISGMNSACVPANDIVGIQRSIGATLDIGPYEWHP